MVAQYQYEVGPFIDVAPVWGDQLWPFLNEAEIVTRMVNASDAGRPAAEAIASELCPRFGEHVRENW